MMALGPAMALAMALTLGPVTLLACEVAQYEPGQVVQPATFGADCSFTIPGPALLYTDIRGAAAVNIGGGRIGQRISEGYGCGFDEEIWVVDCNSGDMIGIDGPVAEDMNQSRRVDLLYPPHGTLRLGPDVTVPDIAAMAKRAGYSHRPDILAHLREEHRLSHPGLSRLKNLDPACGCRRFYPDSALATR